MQLTEVLLLRERGVCVCWVGWGGGLSYFIYHSVSCTGSPRERDRERERERGGCEVDRNTRMVKRNADFDRTSLHKTRAG